MESVTIRLDKPLAKKIEQSLNPYYATKTEFIREAIREKIKREEQERFLRSLQKKGVPKTLTKQERRKLFEDFETRVAQEEK